MWKLGRNKEDDEEGTSREGSGTLPSTPTKSCLSNRVFRTGVYPGCLEVHSRQSCRGSELYRGTGMVVDRNSSSRSGCGRVEKVVEDRG